MRDPQFRSRLVRRALLITACAATLAWVGGVASAQDEVPVDAGAAAASAASAPPADGAAGAEDSSFLNPDDYVPRGKIARVRGLKTHVPEVHRVKSGDTLWHITATYFRNPYLWPALWSYNPHITNPHWIYPDDLVFLKPAGAGSSDASIRDLFAFSSEVGIMVVPVGYYTQQDLMGDPGDDDGAGDGAGEDGAEDGANKKKRGLGAGRVVFSPEEKSMLTLNDEAYLDWPDKKRRKQIRVGQRFAIYHQLPAVIDYDTDEEVAKKLKLVGVVQIAFNDGETLPTGIITDAIQEVQRGDLVLPLEDALFRLMPTTNTTDAEGKIIDSFDLITQFGDQQFVLIDLGKNHKVKTGNRFVAFEQREGLEELEPGEEERRATGQRSDEKPKTEEEKEEDKERRYTRPGDKDWPLGDRPEGPDFPGPTDEEEEQFQNKREYTQADLPLRQIGEIIVVKSSDNFATALILDSRREFNIGQRITLLSGY